MERSPEVPKLSRKSLSVEANEFPNENLSSRKNPFIIDLKIVEEPTIEELE